MKAFFFFLLITLSTSQLLLSQDYYRILQLKYEYAPDNRHENHLENYVDIQEYEANLSLPVPRENGDAIVFGVGYNDIQLFPSIKKVDPEPDTIVIGDHSYGRFRTSLGYNIKLNEDKNITFMGFFRVASDFVNVTSDHYLYGGLFLKNSRKSEKFVFKWGMYANTEHYGWLLIPLIGCDWKATEKLRIFGVLPRGLTIAWTMNERIRSGFVFEAPNRTYRLSENTMIDVKNNVPIDGYVQSIKNVLYAFGEIYLTKSLALRARVGYTLFREIELYEYQSDITFMTWGYDYGADRTPVSQVPAYKPLEDNFVLNASLEYRFSLE